MPEANQSIEAAAVLSRTLSRALLPVVLLIFAAPFVGLMFCASLTVDDFAKATLATPGYICVTQPHFFYAAGLEYTRGSGRWLANFMESAVENKLNLFTSYGWLLLLVMLTNIAGLAYFFMNFMRVPRAGALLAAGVLYAAWLASFTFPGENIFWLTGAMEYQLPITTLLIIGGLLSKPRQTFASYVLLAALAIAIPAQHEVAGVFLLVCLLAGAIAAWIVKSPLRPWLLCLALAAVSVAAIMFSPGMALKRVGGYSMESYVVHLLPFARRSVERGVDWISNPAVLLSAFCIPLLLWPHGDRESEYRPPRWLALAGIAAMCALLGELANAEMTSGVGEFSPRVTGWFQFVFCVLLACVVSVGVPEMSRIRFSPASRIGIFALLAVSLLSSGTFHQAERDLRGPAVPWHRSAVARLTQKNGGSLLQLEALPPKPVLFVESGLSKNTGCWVNQCLALYLGANEVSLKGPSENHWGGGNPCSAPTSN